MSERPNQTRCRILSSISLWSAQGPPGWPPPSRRKRPGFRVALVDKGCVCNSIFHYPAHMTFFTTSERLEIGGIPFPSPNAKPGRGEALEYYRQVAAHYRLDVRQYHRVESVTGSDGAFTVHTADRFGRPGKLEARKLAISTGYYDLPNWMDIPGETLSKVHHYYHDPHPYYGMDVAVIGGKNSAAIAALELWRSGARVTLIYRGPGQQPHVKYWIKPDIENRIKNGEIKAYFSNAGRRDHARRDRGGHSCGPRDPGERFCLCHDRIPSRLHFSGTRWACASRAPTGCLSAIPRHSKATFPASI